MPQLTIDTAGPIAGLALTDGLQLVADWSWRTRDGHAAELVPAIERLLAAAAVPRTALDGIFVCRGPGSYAGLRVGISTAMGLSFALNVGLLAGGRLEADAFMHAAAATAIVPVHAAGRGELAWAVYQSVPDWQELTAPCITGPEELLAGAPAAAVLCGEIDDDLRARSASRPDLRVISGPAHHRRAAAIAALAWPRYQAGLRDQPGLLEPVYLRDPYITTKKP